MGAGERESIKTFFLKHESQAARRGALSTLGVFETLVTLDCDAVDLDRALSRVVLAILKGMTQKTGLTPKVY